MVKRQDMTTKKSWEEFRKSGLLWFVNTILHTFGWSIVVNLSNDKIVDVHPARTSFRGFDEKTNTEGHKKIAKYLKENINILEQEANA